MSVRPVARAALIALLLPAATARAATVRVLVLGVEETDVYGKDVAQLPEAVSRYITLHHDFQVVPEIDMRLAVAETRKTQRACIAAAQCLREVGKATHADFVLTSSVTHLPSGYVVELSRVDVKKTSPPRSAVENTTDREKIIIRARFCIDRLFTWQETVEQPAPPPPAPVPKPSAPKPAPPRQAASAPAPENDQPEPTTPAPPPAPITKDKDSLALMAVTHGESFSELQAKTLESLLHDALDATGKFRVVGRKAIDSVMSEDARKDANGCVDQDCQSQVAAALGVEFVASADLGRLGDESMVTFKIISVRTAVVVARAQLPFASDAEFPATAKGLVAQVMETMYGVAPAALAPAPRPVEAAPVQWERIVGWIAVGVGAAAVAGGVGLGLSSRSLQNEIHTSPHLGATALQLMQQGNTNAIGADIAFAGGGVLGAGGIALVVCF